MIASIIFLIGLVIIIIIILVNKGTQNSVPNQDKILEEDILTNKLKIELCKLYYSFDCTFNSISENDLIKFKTFMLREDRKCDTLRSVLQKFNKLVIPTDILCGHADILILNIQLEYETSPIIIDTKTKILHKRQIDFDISVNEFYKNLSKDLNYSLNELTIILKIISDCDINDIFSYIKIYDKRISFCKSFENTKTEFNHLSGLLLDNTIQVNCNLFINSCYEPMPKLIYYYSFMKQLFDLIKDPYKELFTDSIEDKSDIYEYVFDTLTKASDILSIQAKMGNSSLYAIKYKINILDSPIDREYYKYTN